MVWEAMDGLWLSVVKQMVKQSNIMVWMPKNMGCHDGFHHCPSQFTPGPHVFGTHRLQCQGLALVLAIHGWCWPSYGCGVAIPWH